jgi:hypothetical protein
MSNAGNPTAGAPSVEESSWQDHPVAITVAAVGGALLLGGVLYLAGAFAGETGDEPPIRVKNGSVELYLATSHEKWHEKDSMHYKITGGTRSKDALDVVIAVNAGATCSAQAGTGSTLTVVYQNADNTTTTITVGTDPDNPNQKHSAVASTAPLSLSSSDPRVLTYVNSGGFIREIRLDGTNMCTFTAGNQLAMLVILDY